MASLVWWRQIDDPPERAKLAEALEENPETGLLLLRDAEATTDGEPFEVDPGTLQVEVYEPLEGDDLAMMGEVTNVLSAVESRLEQFPTNCRLWIGQEGLLVLKNRNEEITESTEDTNQILSKLAARIACAASSETETTVGVVGNGAAETFRKLHSLLGGSSVIDIIEEMTRTSKSLNLPLVIQSKLIFDSEGKLESSQVERVEVDKECRALPSDMVVFASLVSEASTLGDALRDQLALDGAFAMGKSNDFGLATFKSRCLSSFISFESVVKVLAAIIHIANVEFESMSTKDGLRAVITKESITPLSHAARLIGCEKRQLEASLCGGRFQVEEALTNRDRLNLFIFSSLLHWVVKTSQSAPNVTKGKIVHMWMEEGVTSAEFMTQALIKSRIEQMRLQGLDESEMTSLLTGGKSFIAGTSKRSSGDLSTIAVASGASPDAADQVAAPAVAHDDAPHLYISPKEAVFVELFSAGMDQSAGKQLVQNQRTRTRFWVRCGRVDVDESASAEAYRRAILAQLQSLGVLFAIKAERTLPVQNASYVELAAIARSVRAQDEFEDRESAKRVLKAFKAEDAQFGLQRVFFRDSPLSVLSKLLWNKRVKNSVEEQLDEPVKQHVDEMMAQLKKEYGKTGLLTGGTPKKVVPGQAGTKILLPMRRRVTAGAQELEQSPAVVVSTPTPEVKEIVKAIESEPFPAVISAPTIEVRELVKAIESDQSLAVKELVKTIESSPAKVSAAKEEKTAPPSSSLAKASATPKDLTTSPSSKTSAVPEEVTISPPMSPAKTSAAPKEVTASPPRPPPRSPQKDSPMVAMARSVATNSGPPRPARTVVTDTPPPRPARRVVPPSASAFDEPKPKVQPAVVAQMEKKVQPVVGGQTEKKTKVFSSLQSVARMVLGLIRASRRAKEIRKTILMEGYIAICKSLDRNMIERYCVLQYRAAKPRSILEMYSFSSEADAHRYFFCNHPSLKKWEAEVEDSWQVKESWRVERDGPRKIKVTLGDDGEELWIKQAGRLHHSPAPAVRSPSAGRLNISMDEDEELALDRWRLALELAVAETKKQQQGVENKRASLKQTSEGASAEKRLSSTNMSARTSTGAPVRPPPRAVLNTAAANVLKELIETERLYVNDLHHLLLHYRRPLELDLAQHSEGKAMLSDADMSAIFGNVAQVLKVHQELLSSLDEKQAMESFAQAFGEMMPFLKGIYTVYVQNYPLALSTLAKCTKSKQKFANFIQNVSQSKVCPDLESYLIKPVQRLCKYPLFMKQLVDIVSKEENQEHLKRIIAEASTAVNRVAMEVNLHQRDAARTVRGNYLAGGAFEALPKALCEPGRTYLDEFVCEVTRTTNEAFTQPASKVKVWYGFLFSDALIFAKKAINTDKYKFRAWIDLENVVLDSPVKNGEFAIDIIQYPASSQSSASQNMANEDEGSPYSSASPSKRASLRRGNVLLKKLSMVGRTPPAGSTAVNPVTEAIEKFTLVFDTEEQKTKALTSFNDAISALQATRKGLLQRLNHAKMKSCGGGSATSIPVDSDSTSMGDRRSLLRSSLSLSQRLLLEEKDDLNATFVQLPDDSTTTDVQKQVYKELSDKMFQLSIT